jgi:hypothetical protein
MPGVHTVAASCPRCHREVPLLIGLYEVLTITAGEIPALRMKLTGKAVLHDCQQTRINLVSGELIVDP